MKKVRKIFGERPIETVVNETKVAFDHEGVATVEDEVAETLLQIPGYELIGDEGETNEEPKQDDVEQSDASDDEPEAEADEANEEDETEGEEAVEATEEAPEVEAPKARKPRPTARKK